MTASPDSGLSPQARLAFETATALAEVLPASEPLAAGDPQPGTEHVTGLFAGAAVADLTGAVTGRIAVLVGEELVAALKSSPMGGLDLAAAVQPALDAAASALGAQASAARGLDLALVLDELVGGTGPFTAVPLLGSGIAAAVLVPDTTLETAATVQASGGAAGGPSAASPAAEAVAAPAGAAVAPVPAGMPIPQVPPAGAPGYENVTSLAGRRGIEMLHGVEMEVTVELGRTRMPVRELLALAPGTVIALDRAAGSPADLLVNGRLIARGEVVVVDEDFGLRITEILDQQALA
ncbi:flagellar motor switch protein FliN [Nocardioides sp. TRM66260-LWL]|uniref:flagellar motor switch protein FliN n=1 Tax=Nocardioides sp. TRM66260-LWL TaxID=2874478 RepID=UPI001CC3C836|nr:flagellar motor switch protein FliN [Nocardioides sp. TRM66260-LWL]MBZ5735193.1 flagellar motor switch protein FliN [Nocardioides sp. TRM66260-LWL]